MRAAKVWLRANFTFTERFVVENSCDRAPCRPTKPIPEKFYIARECTGLDSFFSPWCLISPAKGGNYGRSRKSEIAAWHANFSAPVDDSRKWAYYFSKFYPIDVFTHSIYSFERTDIDQITNTFRDVYRNFSQYLLIIKNHGFIYVLHIRH